MRSEWVKYVAKCGRTIFDETEVTVEHRCDYIFQIQNLRFYRRPVWSVFLRLLHVLLPPAITQTTAVPRYPQPVVTLHPTNGPAP